MIDRYLLRYFLAVVDCGAFSRAATQANVSQPTLSAGIAKLERLLGAKVFHRNNRRVHLTEAGAKLLVHARRIESEFNLAERSLQGIHSPRLFRLGLLTTISGLMVGDAIARSLAADPECRIELIEGSERETANALSRGRVDAALTLVGRGGDRFEEIELYTEGYGVAMPVTHRLSRESVISAEALADNVMIVRRHCEALSETSRHFTERGVRPFFAMKSANDERVLDMVASGLGVTIAPISLARPGVAILPLAGFGLQRSVGLAFADEASRTAHASHPMMRQLISQRTTIA